MTKEQFLTFKSDFKKGITIIGLGKKHIKAWWNDGFASQDEQKVAQAKVNLEIQELRNSITLKRKQYNGTEVGVVFGELAHEHWAYYCAKHQLSEDESKEYVKNEISKMTKSLNEYGYYDYGNYSYSIGTIYYRPNEAYDKYVKPILDAYEKIVCTD